MGRLAGKRAIVTGAGSGIGRASATLFAAQGARVLAVDRSESVHETAQAIREAGGQAESMTADAGLEADVKAYVARAVEAFGGLDVIPTAVALIRRHPNILVTQTLSKSRSLAGLRVGFAIGQPELIEALTRVKDSFNSYPLDRLALVGASAAMDDEAWFDTTRRQVIASRNALSASLAGLGFDVLPSAANFVFARHPRRDAAALAAALRDRSIIVRHFKAERIDQFLRITVGTDSQCALLIDALREIVA